MASIGLLSALFQRNPNPVPIAVTDGTDLYVAKGNAAGDVSVVGGGGFTLSVGTELTRPSDANAYAIGDAIANSTTANLVTPLQFTAGRAVGGTGRIIGAELVVDSATAFGAIRLHLFNTTPFAAAGFQADNSALALTYTALKTGSAGALPNYIGYIDFTSFQAQSASAVAIGAANLTELAFACAAASQTIFGLLEARAVFTPGNPEKFSVVLNIVQD